MLRNNSCQIKACMCYGKTPASNSTEDRGKYPHEKSAPHVGAFFLFTGRKILFS